MTIDIKRVPQKNFVLEQKQMDLEAGYLGKWFGSSQRASMNIAGLLIFLLVLTGIVSLFLDTKIPSSEYWKMIIPLITLIIGFIFGKSSS